MSIIGNAKVGFMALTVGALAGCNVAPTVKYVEAVNQGDMALQPKLLDSFYRQKNELEIEWKPKASTDEAGGEIFVNNHRKEDKQHRIMMVSADPFWAKTTINITKIPNTDLISVMNVDVLDRRVEVINTIGSVTKILIPFAAGVDGGQKDYKCDQWRTIQCNWSLSINEKDGKPSEGSGHEELDKGLDIYWGAVPRSALPVSGVDYRNLLSTAQSGIFYAACRDVELVYSIKSGKDNPAAEYIHYSWKGRVADPSYVEFIAFPKKGSIEFHSQCGVSVTGEKDTTTAPDLLVNAAVTQAIAIKEAFDKADEAKKAKEAAEKATVKK